MKYLLSGAVIAGPLLIAGPPAVDGADTQHTARPSRSMADRMNHQELRRVAPIAIERAMIALESSEKSHSPMLTERIKA